MQTGATMEWRKFWTLPIAAALGNSSTVLHVYSMSAFMQPLEETFGWTRAQISLGMPFASTVSSLMGIFVGILIDRIGPRPVGLTGILIICSAFALLGTASGGLANWFMLWCLLGVGGAWVKPTIWTSAVASRFDASRGLAIAIVVSGAGVAATIIPPLTTWSIGEFGWRQAFFLMGGLWALVVFPLLFFFFRGAQDVRKKASSEKRKPAGDAMAGLTFKQGIRSPAFYKLGIAGGLFAFAVIGLIMHFIPILQGMGVSRMGAAGIAGLVGISSVIGRLGTGFLLDRFQPHRIAMIAFLLPVVSALLLLNSSGTMALSAAALIVGLSLGSELDVVLYLSTRHLGLKRFGVLFALMLIFLAIGNAIGPVYAGAIYDHFGNYTWFLWTIIPFVIVGAALMGSLGPAPDHGEPQEAAS
ncbi:MAG: MFS transporter [Novosphingobium sp.]|nr:MFS transporter [Novosphingobium sp.]